MARGTASDPLAAFFAKGSGAHVALGPGPQGGLSIWTETGPATAACLRVDAKLAEVDRFMAQNDAGPAAAIHAVLGIDLFAQTRSEAA